MELDLAGRGVLIAGATSGIGRACTLAFAEEGARVGIVDMDADATSALADRVRDECGADSSWVVADIAEELEAAAAVESMAARFGGIDVVVTAAAAAVMHGDGADLLDRVLRAGVLGPFRLVQHAVKHLAEATDPAIVLVGPAGGPADAPGSLASCTASGALTQLTRMLSLEMDDRGIRVNCVSTSNADPTEVADQVLWLASSRSAALNGRCTMLDVHPPSGALIARAE